MRNLLRTCLILSMGFAPPALLRAQDRDEVRAAYLASAGLSEVAAELKDLLMEELQAVADPDADRLSRMYSFVMAVHGLDARLVRQLEAGGIDIVHSIRSNSRRFIEQGLYSDPAVFGEVTGFENLAQPMDGYQSTVTVKVLETLKGRVDADTIYLRQRWRIGDTDVTSRDFVPEVGKSYLLLLSKPMYDAALARRRLRGEIPDDPVNRRSDHYAIYRFYEADSTRVVMGDGSAYASRIAFQELRWLQELIDEL